MKRAVAGHVKGERRPAEARSGSARVLNWRLLLSVAASVLVGVLVWINRGWLLDALGLARSARPDLLLASLAVILCSYLVSSRVFGVALHSLHYRIGVLRLWTTALTAIVISQSIPAGGIGSYAFLLSAFRRRGVPAGQATLLAALEALSYAVAMLLIGVYSIAYLLAHAAGGADLLAAPRAGAAALLLIGAAVWALTRSERTIRRVSMRCAAMFPAARRRGAARTLHRTATELLHARELLATQPRLVALLVVIQLVALCGHGLALLLLLWALGTHASYGVALAAFGVALITSTFNVLPGGGGTVETAVVATLLQHGVGAAAVPAAILFRLLNFWALLPVAGVGYVWLIGKRSNKGIPEK